MVVTTFKFNRYLLFLVTLTSSVFAAPSDPPAPTPPPPPGVPIDNGIIFLLIIGLIYGVYKLRNFKLQSK